MFHTKLVETMKKVFLLKSLVNFLRLVHSQSHLRNQGSYYIAATKSKWFKFRRRREWLDLDFDFV